MKIEKIQKFNVAKTVFEQMRQMIIEGEWPAGQKIPSENELAEAFGVSRPTIRQAIQRLDALGLVETRTGEGSFVREAYVGTYFKQLLPIICIGEDNIRQGIQYRLIVEVECAAMAAKNATSEDIVELEECYARMIQPEIDLDSVIEHDFAFHQKLMEMTNNVIIIEVQNMLRDVLKRTVMELTREFTNDSGVKYHKLLIEAIKLRDAEAAREHMRKHLTDMLNRFEATHTDMEDIKHAN